MNRVVSCVLKYDDRSLGSVRTGITRKTIIYLSSLVMTAFWAGLIYLCSWAADISISVPLFMVVLVVIFLVSRLCLSAVAIASEESDDDDADHPSA